MAEESPGAQREKDGPVAELRQHSWTFGEWTGFLGLVFGVVGVAAAAFFFFVAPTMREFTAFPERWTESSDASHIIAIHKSATELRQEGELTYLLSGNPYSSRFVCQAVREGDQWRGKCNYEFTVKNTGFHCQVQTNEVLTQVSTKKIAGMSQELVSPTHVNQCPTVRGGQHGDPTIHFEFVPAN